MRVFITLLLCAGVAAGQCTKWVWSAHTQRMDCAQWASGLPGGAASGALTGTYPSPKIANLTTGGAIPFVASVPGAVTFTGTGPNDMTVAGVYSGAAAATYCAKVDAAGTPDTFSWGTDTACENKAKAVAMTGAAQALEYGLSVTFKVDTGHTVGDKWAFSVAAPAGTLAQDPTKLSYDPATKTLEANILRLPEIETPDAPVGTAGILWSEPHKGFSVPLYRNSTGPVLQFLRDNVTIVKDNTGAGLTKGTVVYITGQSGNVPAVAPAQADNMATLPAMGVLAEDIAKNGFGRMMGMGALGLDTSIIEGAGVAAGDRLWVSAATAGKLANTEPAYPAFSQRIGLILVAGVGTGLINIDKEAVHPTGLVRGAPNLVTPEEGVFVSAAGEVKASSTLTTATIVRGAASLTGSKALLLDVAAATAGPSALADDGTNIYTTASRKYGFGTFARTGNTTPIESWVRWGGNMVVGDPATLGSETLNETDFATVLKWSKTGDFTITGGNAAFSFSGGTGTITQTLASMAITTAVDGKWYKLVYTVSGTTATDAACSVTTTFADSTFLSNLVIADGVARELYLKSKTTPTSFVISCTATAGGFTLDDLSLKEVTGGGLSLSGNLLARGGTFYGGSGATTLTVRAGAVQGSVDTIAVLDAAGIARGGFLSSTSTWYANRFDITSGGASGKWDGSNLSFPAAVPILWSASTNATGTKDLGIFRGNPGLLDITSGTAGKWAGLQAGSVTLQSLATPTITSVTPSANNTVTCTYTLTAYLGDGTTGTAASAEVSTDVGPTNCNSNTIVWTAASNVSIYRLARTVGGTSQGLITAMAGWLNNTTNCPAGVCTYVDTGLAASGAAPTINRTGALIVATVTPADATAACTAGRVAWDASYVYVCTAANTWKRAAISTWP